MRKNIQLIKTIEDYKRKGLNYPRTKKPRPHTPIPQHHCKKFRDNPQKFFTEDLCDNVLKAYRLKKKNNSKNLFQNNRNLSKSASKKVIRVEKATKNIKMKKSSEEERKCQNTMYNIKKFFEDNKNEEEKENLSDH